MSNRHSRRADLRSFKRDAHREHLLTFLIDATDDAALDRMPLLRRATVFWRGNIPQRRPVCPGCKASFADAAQPGAYLFATIAITPTNAAVTTFCVECWRDLPLDLIEQSAARILQKVLPNGRFEPLDAP